MDLEVVGRHALFFDDDANASFVNSRDALVEWNSLFIDRYDVRHLLPSPLPPKTRRRHLTRSSSSPPPPPNSDVALESELDQERYLDLPLPSPSDDEEQDTGNDPEEADAGGYRAVGFSYGSPDESTEQKSNDTEPVFHPAFPVPENLTNNLPPTEKIHQIIARTATFVAKHGGQSEIILRVKQGDNPTFGFLMPYHHLHTYFRFLVDHQELLEHDTDGKSLEEKKDDSGVDQTGGALSLLGSAYGSGEDEDDLFEDAPESKKVESYKVGTAVSASAPNGSASTEFSGNVGKNDIVSKTSCIPLKEKIIIKHNRTVIGATISGMKKESDASGLLYTDANKSPAVTVPSTSKIDLPILEPPSDQKRVVDKIVEFILKNGREFEAVLVEQNCKHGRFLFLLPSNQYHLYYLKALQEAQESNIPGKGLVAEKHESVGHVVDKRTAKGGDTISSESAVHGLPVDYDRKEKLKMATGKPKQDEHDPSLKPNQPQSGISVYAAAAILQAATRGIRYPGLEIFPKSSSGTDQGYSNEGGQDLSSGNLRTLQPQTSMQKANSSGEPHIPIPIGKAIAETAALAAASEADSSEASLTREQKLKAERLKRAKMFAAMIKSGSALLKSGSLRALSVEPTESGVSSSGNEVINLLAKEREGSSVPLAADISDKVYESEKKASVDEFNERRLKRSYRTRSKGDEGEGDDNDLEREKEEEDERGDKHSRKKRRSHHSSKHGKDRNKHRRHSSSKDGESRCHHKHDNSSDEKHRHSRRRRKISSSDDEHQPQKRHRHDSSADDDYWHVERNGEHRNSRLRHKNYSDSSDDGHQHSRRGHKQHSDTSEDEHRHRRRSVKDRKPKSEKLAEIEGEIYTKSNQSRASREASVDISKSDQVERAPSQPSQATEVPDDLRAKIRAMLMATL